MTPVIELQGISKRYPERTVWANRRVSLELRPGEILCLAGENGAGKTTLMKILYGLVHPTEGEILVRGKRVKIHSPLEANRLGIGMVHQHFMLFPEFTVAQNVVMGAEPVKWGFLYDNRRAVETVSDLILRHHFSVDAETPVSGLTVGQMQQVEILKLLYREVSIFILDEPTAALTDQETAAFFRTLRALAESGRSLILITHKLNEIKEISHRVAILRRGELMGIRETGAVDEYEISRLMFGQGLDLHVTRSKGKIPQGPPVLAFQDVTVIRRGQERPLLNRVSFEARGGEILAFAGVGGNGLGVLEAVLGGFLHPSAGNIRFRGRDISRLTTGKLRRQGLAYVPADRLSVGSAPESLVWENLIVNRRGEFFRRIFPDQRGIARFTGDLFTRYDIAGQGDMKLRSLSGGNIQKVILAREIDQYRDYILFSEPTWGLDVSGSRYVYEQMAALRDRGAAVILISSNLDEILANAGRVLVFYRGAITLEIRDISEDLNAVKESIGNAMLGLTGRREPEAVHGSRRGCPWVRALNCGSAGLGKIQAAWP
jgi:simple sugar transport system ATP-binding protein